MTAEFARGDEVEIAYESTRSGNVVSRTGTVVQVPGENDKAVLFVETDENQLTGVTADQVFSVSVEEADEETQSRVGRTVPLGRVESVTSQT